MPIGRRIFAYALAACLLTAAHGAEQIRPGSDGRSDSESARANPVTNWVELVATRTDDFLFPFADFIVWMDMELPAVAGVSSVFVVSGSGVVEELETFGGVEWEGEWSVVDLDALKNLLDGTWSIVIVGSEPSTSTFALDASTLVEGDFYDTATMITPTQGQIGVSPDVVFEWTDPTGVDEPDALLVFVEDEIYNFQEDDSIGGSMAITDTTWDPPLDLIEGVAEFEVIYADVDDSGRMGGLTVTDGAITWGLPPDAPPGYPDATPFFVRGSTTIIEFQVGGPPCPADTNGDNVVDTSDFLNVLGAWGTCDVPCPPYCSADTNEDCNVDTSDFLEVLGAWGACP